MSWLLSKKEKELAKYASVNKFFRASVFLIKQRIPHSGERMKHHYLILIEKELKRLWINQYSIAVIEQGKDKFLLSDGKRGFIAKGFEIIRHIKLIPDKAGYGKFWEGMRELEKKGKVNSSRRSSAPKK